MLSPRRQQREFVNPSLPWGLASASTRTHSHSKPAATACRGGGMRGIRRFTTLCKLASKGPVFLGSSSKLKVWIGRVAALPLMALFGPDGSD